MVRCVSDQRMFFAVDHLMIKFDSPPLYVTVAGLALPDVFTAHLPNGVEHYSYSWLLYNAFGRIEMVERLADWVLPASLALESRRMSTEFLVLLRRCRLEGDPEGMAYVDRFWLAVYFKAHNDDELNADLARRFRVVRAHLYAAVALRLLPSECDYYAPMDYIQMMQFSEVDPGQRLLMFVQLGSTAYRG